MHHLDGAWAEMLGWALVLVGLAVLAGLIVIFERRSAKRFHIPQMPPRLDQGREWAKVMHRATRELARGPRVEELQADAAVAIQSAEYAYNRLVVDCAQHCTVPAPPPEPTLAPAPPKPSTTPTPAEEPAPLAA